MTRRCELIEAIVKGAPPTRIDAILATQDIDIDSTEGGESLLKYACSVHDSATVRKLLACGASIHSVADDKFAQKKTLLHYACEESSPFGRAKSADSDKADVVTALLEVGAQVNARTIDAGLTPLMCVAYHCDVRSMRTLLSHGADATARDVNRASVAMYALTGAGDGAATIEALMQALRTLLAYHPAAVAGEETIRVVCKTKRLCSVFLLQLLVENGATLAKTTPPFDVQADVAALLVDDARRRKLRARHLLRVWAAAVRVRPWALYWQEATVRSQCDAGGECRKRDRKEFEEDFLW